jgi:hypothetical protein
MVPFFAELFLWAVSHAVVVVRWLAGRGSILPERRNSTLPCHDSLISLSWSVVSVDFNSTTLVLSYLCPSIPATSRPIPKSLSFNTGITGWPVAASVSPTRTVQWGVSSVLDGSDQICTWGGGILTIVGIDVEVDELAFGHPRRDSFSEGRYLAWLPVEVLVARRRVSHGNAGFDDLCL